MRFHRFISNILHPAVIPTLGVLLYFMFISQSLARQQQLILLALVFGITYVIPVISLFLLKALGIIESFQVKTIQERRLPVLVMVVLFYILGDILAQIPTLRDLGFLFYGSCAGLAGVYALFAFKIKTSLHLLAMGNAVGFFIIIINLYALSLIALVMVLILLSGLVASARLHLKAHKPSELFVGFLLGIGSQIITFFVL